MFSIIKNSIFLAVVVLDCQLGPAREPPIASWKFHNLPLGVCGASQLPPLPSTPPFPFFGSSTEQHPLFSDCWGKGSIFHWTLLLLPSRARLRSPILTTGSALFAVAANGARPYHNIRYHTTRILYCVQGPTTPHLPYNPRLWVQLPSRSPVHLSGRNTAHVRKRGPTVRFIS